MIIMLDQTDFQLTVNLRGLDVQLGGHAGGDVEEPGLEGVDAVPGQGALHAPAAAAGPRGTHGEAGI